MTVADFPIVPNKAAVVEFGILCSEARSFADLGACWGVHGGYTSFALELGGIERAVLVDGRVTELTRERTADWDQLEIYEAPLGAQTTVDKVGKVDAAIMFDILLHQVDPHWDEFLERYAANVDTLIIHNQCWRGEETVRFADMDVEEYIARVEPNATTRVREWYARHDEWSDEQNRPLRDVHNYWQWGITVKDLVGTLWDLGYRIEGLENSGLWLPEVPDIESVSLIARRRHS